MVIQEMLESTNSQQIDDPSTVILALLTVVSKRQVNSGGQHSANNQDTAIV